MRHTIGALRHFCEGVRSRPSRRFSAGKTIAKNAIANDYFAVAQLMVRCNKDCAFQASSPKTFRPSFGAAYFFVPFVFGFRG
jgi:hypothetical protein